MEENIIEQPSLNTSEPENQADEGSEGSILGKFKDAKTLLEAYNSLQSEFTRKSQKLAELQKKSDDFAKIEAYDNLDDFLAKHAGNDKYKKDITEIIATDNEICSLPNKFNVALKIAKLAESKSAETLNSQEYLDNHVYNNASIKEKVISDYLSNLNGISPVPKTTFGSSPIYFSPATEKPKTLQEAGEIFKKMLK